MVCICIQSHPLLVLATIMGLGATIFPFTLTVLEQSPLLVSARHTTHQATTTATMVTLMLQELSAHLQP